jgi:hypothetical protein
MSPATETATPASKEAVTLDEARIEAAARATRLVAVVAPLWKASRQWTAAIVLALFPFLFILDEAAEFPLSPVLPGLVVLVVLIIVLPFLLVELRARRFRRKDPDWQAKTALKAVGVSRAALAIAAVWVLVWFAVGT